MLIELYMLFIYIFGTNSPTTLYPCAFPSSSLTAETFIITEQEGLMTFAKHVKELDTLKKKIGEKRTQLEDLKGSILSQPQEEASHAHIFQHSQSKEDAQTALLNGNQDFRKYTTELRALEKTLPQHETSTQNLKTQLLSVLDVDVHPNDYLFAQLTIKHTLLKLCIDIVESQLCDTDKKLTKMLSIVFSLTNPHQLFSNEKIISILTQCSLSITLKKFKSYELLLEYISGFTRRSSTTQTELDRFLIKPTKGVQADATSAPKEVQADAAYDNPFAMPIEQLIEELFPSDSSKRADK